MLNDRIPNIQKLRSALLKAEEYLHKLPSATPYEEFGIRLVICVHTSYFISYLAPLVNAFANISSIFMQTPRNRSRERMG